MVRFGSLPVVDFIGYDENIVLDTKISDLLELLFGEDFTDRVMWGVDDDHLGAWSESGLEFCKVNSPLR